MLQCPFTAFVKKGKTVKMPRRWLGACLTVALLGGCAGVPWSTLWRMRDFGPADLVRLDPAHLRAAVQLPVAVDLKNGVTTLAIGLTRKDGGKKKFVLPLRRVAEGRAVDPGLPPAGDSRHWLLFRLTAEGVQSFRHLQDELHAGADAYREAVISVHFDLAEASERQLAAQSAKPPALPFSLWLRLRTADGFFELFGGKIRFTFKPAKP